MNKADFLRQWLVDNYPYVVLAMAEEKDRPQIQSIINACKKHDVPFKTFMDIMSDVMGGNVSEYSK